MKIYPAMAAIEFRDISAGLHATDAMMKKAPIAFLKAGTITDGRFLALFGGSTASVQEAMQEAHYRGGSSILDHVLLADIHPRLHDAILGKRMAAGGDGSLAIMETMTVSSAVRGAELALKGTPVALLEIRLADQGLAGKGLVVLQGELHDIEAAVDLVVGHLREIGRTPVWRIVSAPHEAMARQLAGGTSFAQGTLLELDGELV